MDAKIIIVGGLVLIVLCVSLGALAGPVVELEQTQAETSQVEAQTELAEAETERETLETFTVIIRDLLAEIRAERKSQRDSLQEVLALFERLGDLMILAIVGNMALTAALMLTVIAGGIVGIVALSRRKRQTMVMLPCNPSGSPQLWLPVEDVSVIPYQTQDRIQIVDLGQEIVIE